MKRKFLWVLPGIFTLSMLATILVIDAGPMLDQAENAVVSDVIQIVKSVLQNQAEPVTVTDGISIVKAAAEARDEPVRVSDGISIVRAAQLTISEPIAVHDLIPDVTPPVVALTNKPPNPTASPQATFSWTISDPDNPSGFQSFCSLDGAPLSACASSISYSALSDGSHTFQVLAADPAGNRSVPVAWTWKVDTTPPTVTCPTADGAWHAANQTFSCRASDSGSGLANPADASFTLSTSVPDGMETNNAATGTHQVCDLVGNCATAGPITGVMIDRKAPVITASAITLGDSKPYSAGAWTNQSVGVTFNCADSGSGVATVSPPVTLSADGANQSVPGSCSDKVGNIATTSIGSIDIDKAPPTLTYLGQRPPANTNGWNNTSVTLSWSCADSLSGVVSPTITQVVSKEGANQSATGICVDNAGNKATNTQSGVNIDVTPPLLTVGATTSDGKPYTSGTWTNQSVTVSFACADALSGVASVTAPVTFSTDGSNQSVTGTCTDKAGNASQPLMFGGVDIDKTPAATGFTAQPGPLNGRQLATVTVNTTINPGASSINTTCYDSFGLNAVLAATDGLSGVAAIKWGEAPITPKQPLPYPALTNTASGASVTIPFTSNGAFVLNYAAVDAAGNQEATHTRWILVNSVLGISCATDPIPYAKLPATGNVTVSGTLQIGNLKVPFAFSFAYPSKQ